MLQRQQSHHAGPDGSGDADANAAGATPATAASRLAPSSEASRLGLGHVLLAGAHKAITLDDAIAVEVLKGLAVDLLGGLQVEATADIINLGKFDAVMILVLRLLAQVGEGGLPTW